MAKIDLKIIGNITDVQNKITTIKTELKSIEQQPIKISVDSSGLQAVDKTAVKVLNAQAKIAAANARVTASENNLKIAQEQTRQIEIRRTLAERQLSAEIERTTNSERNQQRQLEGTNDSLGKASQATEDLTKKTGLLDRAFERIKSTLISRAISGVTSSIRDALNVMREVDDELVTIRKVTGFSGSQIDAIREQAYTTASAYGVGAADYLSSAAQFSRAGYKEQSTALAELSTKTQIVGDTTAEVANQFLISVDAAYKYQGQIEKLNRVLDGANEIDNKYATSIEKIASGMGIVAPVAAQMHVNVDELTAAIGTITAVTQRSGTEAARALRAIFLNIVGDTKTEIEEGVTWTTGEIAGLRDVIKQYAPEAYKAAEATGQIISPMEAIAGLADSMERGLLSEQRLMEMVSDIGGKLRTSQLLALIQNYQMYQDMLTDYAGAMGSADREVQNALDSWTRKTNQLSDSWAKFMSHMVDTETVKGSLDFLIGAVNLLDTDAGRAVVSVTLLSTAVGGLKAAIDAIRISAASGASPFLASLFSPTTLAITGAVAAIYGLIKLNDALTVTYEEQAAVVEKLQMEYDTLYGKGSEYEELKKNVSELTDLERERLTVLEAQREVDKEKLDVAALEKYYKWLDEQSGPQTEGTGILGPNNEGKNPVNDIKLKEQYQDAREQLDGLKAGYAAAETGADAYKTALQRLLVSLNDSVNHIREGKELGAEMTESGDGLLKIYEEITQAIEALDEAETSRYIPAKTSIPEINAALKSQAVIYGEIGEKANALNAAMEETAESGGMTDKTMETLVELFPDLRDELTLTADGWYVAADALEEYYNALSKSYAETTVWNLVSSNELIASSFDGTTQSILESLYALREMNELAQRTNPGDFDGAYDYVRAHPTDISSIDAAIEAIETGAFSVTGSNAKKNRLTAEELLKKLRELREKSPKGDTTDKALENRKDAVALLKQQYEYLSASGASERELVEKAWEIQKALKSQSAYMKSIGADEKDILSIETEWWSWQNKITKLIEDADDTLSRLKDSLAEAKESSLALLDAQEESAVGPLQAQLDLLKEQRDTVEDTRKEEERRLAVEEARIALENAQNERNVRQYNALTGQWEWAANASAVEKAQKDLADANKALADYYTDREIEALEAQIKTVQTAYDALRDSVNDFSKAIDKGTLSFLDALTYFTEAASRAGLSGMAGDLAAAYMNAGESTVLAKMKENGAKWGAASAAEKKILEDENWRLGTSQGWTRIEGAWYDKAGNRLYDTGGILHGRGAIKATGADEMILPPGMTAALLNAEQNGAFEALLSHLGIMTGAAQTFAGFGGFTSSRIGSQHNGDVYEIGGITLSEAQARGMTVFDLAQMARTLSLHNAS